jgi:predicted dehydrogenase
MAPIRIGIIGLSAEATGTGWAAMAHLPYLLKSPQYKIVALCNRTVENAQAAIKAFDLGSSTKAYGSPDDLAKDPDVDLVVVNTRVDLHAKVLLPSIKAGKDVFCEWPLDGNFENVKEMVETAKQSGGRTIVGLQGRASPIAKKIKQIIEEGRIGKVLSSTLYGATVNGGAEESKMAAYLTDRKVGGNMLTIHFGHSEFFLYIVPVLRLRTNAFNQLSTRYSMY